MCKSVLGSSPPRFKAYIILLVGCVYCGGGCDGEGNDDGDGSGDG